MPYTPPPGTENIPWERFRVEQNIETISAETRPGIMAQFELWKNTNQIEQRFGEVTDFNSPLYQQYANFAQRANPAIGQNSLLAPLLAGGASYGGSQVIAGQQRQDLLKDRTEALNTGVQQFGLGMQGQASGLLGLASGNAQFGGTLAENQRQFNESNEASFLDYAGAFLPGLSLIPGIGGGGASGGGR